MSISRSEIVYIKEGVDEDGNPIQVLKDTVTGIQYLAYSVEAWEQRCAHKAPTHPAIPEEVSEAQPR